MAVKKNLLVLLKNVLLKISLVQATILMGVVYCFVIGPMAILYQLFRQEKKSEKTYWIKKESITDMKLYLKRQF